MKKITYLIATLVFLCCNLLMINSFAQAATSQLENISVRLKWSHQSQFAGFYYAVKEGYYKKAGLNVTLNAGGIDFPAIQMVANGIDQFGISSPDQILLAREKGIPVVAIATIYQQTPAVIMSFKEANITKLSDLIGKKIGIIKGSDDEVIYRMELRKANIDANKIIEIPYKHDQTLFLNKTLDAILAYSTNGAPTIKALGKEINLIYPIDYGIYFYSDTLFTTEKMIKEHPDLVRKFVQATLKGWQAAIKNQQRAISYTLEYDNKLSQNIETEKFKSSIPLITFKHSSIGSMKKEMWEHMQQDLLHFGFMHQAINIDQAFTTKFLP